MILHVYFARKFLLTCLGLTTVLFALTSLMEFIDLLNDFGSFEGVGFWQLVELMFLKSPATIDQILPLILLLSTIGLFLNLARTSEMVVTRASGRSAVRALIAPICVAMLIGTVAVSTLGPIVAASSNKYSTLTENYRAGGSAVLSVSNEGLWLRQGDDDGQTVIRASRSNADGSVLYDVTFLSYAPNGGPIRRLQAESAALNVGFWSLRMVKEWPLEHGGNPEAQATLHETYRLNSSLTLERIRESLGTFSGVSVWDMPDFILQLEQAGFSAQRHKVWFQKELSRPLFLIAMVLVGAAFTMRHTRLGGTGMAVISAVLLGFTMYFAHSFATILGENGQLAIHLAAWAVPVAANLLALGLLLHSEDG